MNAQYSYLRGVGKAIFAALMGGGTAWIVQAYSRYELTGVVQVDPETAHQVASALQMQEVSATALSVFVGVLFAAFKFAKNWVKNDPNAPSILKAIVGDNTNTLWAILLCAALAGTGCAHSGIRLDETMADGSSSKLSITTSSTIGKQDTLQNFSYRGEGEKPWQLTAGQDVQQDTTQALGLLKELLNVAAQIAPLYAPPAPAPVPPVEEGNIRD